MYHFLARKIFKNKSWNSPSFLSKKMVTKWKIINLGLHFLAMTMKRRNSRTFAKYLLGNRRGVLVTLKKNDPQAFFKVNSWVYMCLLASFWKETMKKVLGICGKCLVGEREWLSHECVCVCVGCLKCGLHERRNISMIKWINEVR